MLLKECLLFNNKAVVSGTNSQIHNFQAPEYQKFATGSVKMDITTTPSKDVHNVLSTPRQAKRLKIQHTADIADPMWKVPHWDIQ